MKRMTLMGGVVLALAGVILAACDPYGCTAEFRSVALSGPLTSESGDTLQGPTGNAFISLDQFRGSHTQRSLSWSVRASLPVDTVTEIQLRAGSPADPGETLYEFPVNGTVADVISGGDIVNYTGSIPFDELFDALRTGTATSR